MKITVQDCLKLDAFDGAKIVSCSDRITNRVRTLSVLDEKDYDICIEKNAAPEQLVLTHFWSMLDDVDMQCRLVEEFGRSGVAALVVLLHEKGVTSVDTKVIKTAESSGLLMIEIEDDGRMYARFIEQVLDKILYGENYSENILNNSIYHLLNFDRHSNFQSALKEAALHNQYQIILMTAEFNPILTIETRHEATIEDAIKNARKYDIMRAQGFTKVLVNDVITYWGTIDIRSERHILMIVDNEDNYSATEMRKLAEIIQLAMGMWKYTPERDSRAEFIKAAIRGDLAFCYTLVEEAGLKGKDFISALYVDGIDVQDVQDVMDEYRERCGFGILPYIEGDEFYAVIYADRDEDKNPVMKFEILKMFDELKEGRKDIRIFHSTGIEDIDSAIDGFKMINETKNDVEAVFPYKRVFTKYEMSMVCNCISIQLQNHDIKKMYLDLLEPFDREVTQNKGRLLLETLETFVLDAGMNSGKTSEFMDIHNNTVQYRLRKINELLGADMTGNRVIPGLTMALALRRLEDK